jgi:cytosine/adenosine deaminase-related metal-dependent hydrolase
MLGQFSQEWVIRNVTFFDHDTHSFVAGDIEVDGPEIVAIRPPGSSTLQHGADGRGHVCLPGLVVTQAELLAIHGDPDRLLRAGTTTVGTICRTASECILAASQTKVRLVAHVLLNAGDRAREGCSGIHERGVEVFDRVADFVSSNKVRVLPAVYCASVVSAAELVRAQHFASSQRRRLGLVLADGRDDAQAFRERFYCSETQLLTFLRLLDPGTTVFPGTQLSDRDADTLVRSEVRVAGGYAVAQRRASRQRTWGAIDADRAVDAITVAAGADLGQTDCGRISTGMRADLCLFRSPERSLRGGGSAAFLELLKEQRPDFVITSGRVAYRAPGTLTDQSACSIKLPAQSSTTPHHARTGAARASPDACLTRGTFRGTSPDQLPNMT